MDTFHADKEIMNKKIIVAAVFVGAVGVVNSILGGRGLTRPILGTYIFLLMLAILDMFGGQLSTFAGAFAMVAVLYVLITQFPWQQVLKTIGA